MSNREIRFRAWDGEKMYTPTFIDAETGKAWNETNGHSDDFEPTDDVVTQYSGVKDKHGTDIYEGDILFLDVNEFEDEAKHYLIVKWVDYSPGNYSGGWYADGIYTSKYGTSAWTGDEQEPTKWHEFEIIGNVYQNRQLLEAAS